MVKKEVLKICKSILHKSIKKHFSGFLQVNIYDPLGFKKNSLQFAVGKSNEQFISKYKKIYRKSTGGTRTKVERNFLELQFQWNQY